MATFHTRQKCTHCQTQGVLLSGEGVETMAGVRVPAECNYCGEIMVLKLRGVPGAYLDSAYGHIIVNLDTNTLMSIDGYYPVIEGFAVPQHCPKKVESTFRESIENLQRGNFETAIFLCGRALDLSTKAMDQAWKLEKRLKQLAADGKITTDMANWAEEIRLDRNTATHEEHDFTEGEATDIVTFTEAFLTYVYSLPALISSRRAKRDEV